MSTLIFMNNAKKAKVIEAAQGVFFRYGYRRVTMGDLAAEIAAQTGARPVPQPGYIMVETRWFITAIAVGCLVIGFLAGRL